MAFGQAKSQVDLHGSSMAERKSTDETSLTLMMRVQQNPADDAAWNQFVERYRPMIRAWCHKWGAQASDAEDVAQIVLVKLVTAMKAFRCDPDRSFRGWLKTVTQNAWIDFVKAQKQRQASGGATFDLVADSRDALLDLERELEEAHNREIYGLALRRVEKRVKPETWQAFCLTVLENREGAEAARLMNWTVAHVFVAKHRVQKLLAEEVKALQGPARPE